MSTADAAMLYMSAGDPPEHITADEGCACYAFEYHEDPELVTYDVKDNEIPWFRTWADAYDFIRT